MRFCQGDVFRLNRLSHVIVREMRADIVGIEKEEGAGAPGLVWMPSQSAMMETRRGR